MEGQYERVSQSRELLYSVPAALCEKIARGACGAFGLGFLPWEKPILPCVCMFFLAVPLNFKNPRLSSRFLGALKSGVTKLQK